MPLVLLLGSLAACTSGDSPTDGSPLPAVALAPVADGLVAPVDLAADGQGDLYVVDQVGLVYDVAEAIDPDHPFADLRARLLPLDATGDSRGLLGFAFHPAYPDDPRVFAFYTAPITGSTPPGYDHTDRLSSFVVVNGRVDPASEVVLLEIPAPAKTHDGTGPVFGPNRLLYLGVGDGGGAGDTGLGHPPGGNGQDPYTLLGKILRLDVDSAQPFGIPADNPFVQGGGAPEVYAYGFHDPSGIAFDGHTGELYVTDMGQALLEEVDVVHRGGNYGWNLREGSVCFDPHRPAVPPPACPDTGEDGSPVEAPILTFPHPGGVIRGDGDAGDGVEGTAIVGGIPVRAASLPAWEGHFLFGAREVADDGDGGALFLGTRRPDHWRSTRVGVAGRTDARLGAILRRVAVDGDGEVYVLTSEGLTPSGTGGAVLRVVAGAP